jgi:hypothetical protein
MVEHPFLILKNLRNQIINMNEIGLRFIFVLSIVVCAISCTETPVVVKLPKDDLQKKVQGTWQVRGTTHQPIEHKSFCKHLMLNSIFEFLPDSTLVVRDTMNAIPCNRDWPQRYFMVDSTIRIREFDMLFEYKLLRLTSDSLRFRIEETPSMFYLREDIDSEEWKKELEFYKKNGVVVSLVRIN